MALTKIPSSLLDTSGGFDLQGNITLGDNEKIILGDSSDLQIYHNGSNSYIDDAGTGALNLRSSGIYLEKANGAEVMISAIADGAVTLYHDGSTKLATSSAGATVTGTLTVTGDLDITGNVNSYNVTDLDVTDQTITLGAGQTEANSGGSGIIIDGSNASMLWDESTGEFDFNNPLSIVNSIGGDTVLNLTGSYGSGNSVALLGFARSGGAVSGDIKYVDATTDMEIGTSTAHAFSLKTSGTRRMFISNSGNVGIGTGNDTLTGKLTVKDSSTLDINLIGNPPELNLEDTSSTSGTKRARFGLDNNKAKIEGLSDDDQSVTQSLFIADLSNGNVGIGEITPLRRLHVNSGTTNVVARLQSTDSIAAIEFKDSTGSAEVGCSGNDVVFFPAGSESARVSSGFANTSTSALPAFRTSGSYGGGIGMLDGVSQAGWYQQDNGDTFHHYVGKESSDTPASKIVLTTKANGHVGIMQGGSAAINHPLHVTREEAGYQVKFDNDNGSAQGLAIRIKANDSGNFNAINAVSASSGSDKTVFNVRDDGIVTTPGQVYFLAYRTSNLNPYNFTATSGATTQIFTHVSSTQSSAAGIAAFSTSDGTFSAPVDGLYLFHVSFYSNITIEQAWLTQNGARISYTDMVSNSNGSYTGNTFSSSIQYYMTAGQSIRVHPYSATGNNDYVYDNVYHTYWKGVLLG
jgi:hypothetical protein